MSSSRRKFWSPFFLLFLLTSWSGTTQAKRFVVVVGPHETSTHTTSFLSKYAADDGSGVPSFAGWNWPIVESDEIYTNPKHTFDLLVKEPDNDKIQNAIIDGIRSAWDEAENGVFIGSLDFDKVGTTPFSGYNAVEALVKVVDKVGISAEDVTVIVTYRTPRVNQWGSVWKNHFDSESYQDFVCSDNENRMRWEWLDTSMNPFMLAKTYHDQEWNVGVVDQDSILEAGKDVAHIIACLAMEDENCEDGWVVGIEKSVSKPSSEDKIDLSDEDLGDLERLFLFRDCYYFTQIDQSPRFGVFAEDSGFDMIRRECRDSNNESYAKLSDTEYLMNAIQYQKSCERYEIDIPSVLKEMSESTFDESIEDYESESVAPNDENSDNHIDDENDDDKYGGDTIGDEDDDETSGSESIDDEADDEAASGNPVDDEANNSTFEKKLVVFVGPHETDAVDVTKFFVNYASTNEDYEPLESFNGWSWPLVDDEIIKKPAHHAFDLLVTDPDSEDIQTALLGGIVEAWNKSEKGVIIGSLNFDSTGENPYSGYDPIDALIRVEEALGLDNEDIIVVVNYRSPRIDHWSAVWSNHFGSDDYEDFICSDGELSDKRWEWLDNVMNPFKIAKKYHDKGWNMAVVDQESAINAGTDTSHTIACYLMKGVNCKNGLVVGLENAVSAPDDVIPMDSMSEDDRRDLEQLFRERDCHFKYELKDKERFVILNQRSAWSTCSNQHKTYYEQFTDTDFMLNLLKSQKQCGDSNIDISDMLEKKMVKDDKKKLIVFAGPHETAAIPVTKFFAEHASAEDSTDGSTSLGGWVWPTFDSEILGDTESHRIFDLLLSDADTRPIQNILMDGIRDSWNKAQNGVIIGSLNFDKVGKNPYSNYDALGAIDRVVQTLGISSTDVTIVLNYRSRRIDHLSATWWNHFDQKTLKDFTCSDKQADKRWEWIDTVMNPLKLANAYIEEGWNVAVIEEEGTSFAGKDVSHSLACQLMGDVDCDDGWVRGLRSERTPTPNTYEIDGLDSIQRSHLETLFRMRDCFYKYTLESDNMFTTVNRKELWKSCSLKDKEKYEKVVNTEFFLGVMKSLQGCGDEAESSAFVSELLKSHPASRNSTLIIVAVFLLFACMIFIMLKRKQRKREKVRKATSCPPDGIFRDDPLTVDSRPSSYSDKIVVDENMDEYSSDSEIESGKAPTQNLHHEEAGDVEALDVENFPSNTDRNCMIS